MTLYHGSHTAVPQPLVKVGRNNLDFGQGFYLTRLEEQATAWAEIIASRRGRTVAPVVSIYSFDREKAIADGVRFLIFETYNLDWLYFVGGCRKGADHSEEYDVVEGGVANDNVIDTVEDYEKGIITAEQALGQLRYKKVNHQICILNQKVVDNYLRFTGIKEIQI